MPAPRSQRKASNHGQAANTAAHADDRDVGSDNPESDHGNRQRGEREDAEIGEYEH